MPKGPYKKEKIRKSEQRPLQTASATRECFIVLRWRTLCSPPRPRGEFPEVHLSARIFAFDVIVLVARCLSRRAEVSQAGPNSELMFSACWYTAGFGVVIFVKMYVPSVNGISNVK